ncbi:protein O-GlcNAcase-like [Apteryx mantelli]|uniref:Protein O-GlcNAcase-like n=1 Tax=Apteryx mantelli TaxID=2696672 RepID=A0ABM4EL02_9AVES
MPLLRRLRRWGLNCYMYAPKDELKHRLLWREPYTEHEAAQLQSLIEAAREHGVEFIFAISAGQDMVFSSGGDRLLLQQKLRQVAAAGCRSFALLFDDVDPRMCRADRDVFASLAQAQASVANEMYQELGQPSVFLFCPTEYCSSLCSPSPSQSCYLLTLGQELLPGIGIIWTGPKVVSQELSAMLLEEVEGILQRCPIIWDNLYANDYDCRRVFLGPYTGRAPGLVARLHGLLLNPNCELQANFIPIHTLGSWFRSELGSCTHPEQAGTETAAALGDRPGPGEGSYDPQEALELALRDWVAEINQQTLEPGCDAVFAARRGSKVGSLLSPIAAGTLHLAERSRSGVGAGAAPPCSVLPGRRVPAQPSASCRAGATPRRGGTAGREAELDPQPHGAPPGGSQPSSAAPGEGRGTVTVGPEQGRGSRTPGSGRQSPTGDGDPRTTCEPSSAQPHAAGDSECPGALETLCSPTAPLSDGAGTSPGPMSPLSDGAGTSPGPTAPLSDGAGTSPGPMSPLSDGAGTSPGPTAPLSDGAGTSPGPTAPLSDGAGTSPGPTAPLSDGAGTSPGPTAPLSDGTGTSPGPMSPLSDGAGTSPGPTAPLTLAEARMLVELFYLPYQHGPQAQRLLEHFQWLQTNCPGMGSPAAAPDTCSGERWRGRARTFQLLCAETCRLHGRFVRCAGRSLLYDLHPYLWDVRNVLLAASAFVRWLDGRLLRDPDPAGPWGSCFGWCRSIAAPLSPAGDAEPWARRGGLCGELQALLPVGNSCDLFHHPPPLFPASRLYLLRPLLPADQGELYQMCRESLDCDARVAEMLSAHPDLLGDRLLGSFLSLSPEYTFVLEDEGGLCGYAAGALCAEGFLQQRGSGWLPAMRHKYPRELGMGSPALGQDALREALLFFHAEAPAVPLPVLRRFPSLVQLGTAPRVLDAGASRSLAVCLLSALRAHGSRGVFCEVGAADRQQLSFYGKLGFVVLPVAWGGSPGARLLGRLL